MEQQIYCDGIGRISVIEGMVRLDLYSYSPNETDANGNPRPVLSHRIVMGLDGFLRSSEKVVEAVKVIGQARQQQPRPPQPQQPPPQQAPQPPQQRMPQPPAPQPAMQHPAPPPPPPEPPKAPVSPPTKSPFP
jgi:hypothetical protein